MNSTASKLFVCYGGRLEISNDFSSTYIGGRNRPMEVPYNTSLEDLKIKILDLIRKDNSTHTISIICRYPVGNHYNAMTVEDDYTCNFMLMEATKQTVEIYVEPTELEPTQPREPSFEPAVNLGITTVEPLYYEPSFEQQLFRPTTYYSDFQIGSSSRLHEPSHEPSHAPSHAPSHEPYSFTNIEMADNNSSEDNDEVDYETMDSGSSQDSSEDEQNDTGAEENNTLEGNQIIRENLLINNEDLNNMNANNEFVDSIRNTREWDAANDCDQTFVAPSSIDECIPDQIYEGMIFANKDSLQFALMGWSIHHNVEYRKTCSNKQRLSVECVYRKNSARPCPWRLHAITSHRRGGYWEITKTGGRHCCTHPIMSSGHRNCSSKFISLFIGDVIRKQIDIKPREIIARIDSRFNIRCTYMKAWDARRKAIQKVFGSYEESYRSLFRLMDTICRVMPGSVYRIQVRNTNKFQSIFWSFGPSIQGWKSCRPVLTLDGTFLLGKFRGTLLAAVGIDGNGGLFPLAFAIVESESNESWFWFLKMLLELIEPVRTRQDLCIISDKHHGLVNACREIMPWVAHRHCLRHFRENYKKALRRLAVPDVESLCNKMYNAGSTNNEQEFTRFMNDIKKVKKEAFDWLTERDITKWSLVHDGGRRYGIMTTNASECFNGILKRARGLPIQGLILAIYYNLIAFFQKRTVDAARWAQDCDAFVVPRTLDVIRKNEHSVRQFAQPIIINATEFQVFDKSSRGFKVKMESDYFCSCSCKKPQILHVPCVHVICALAYRRINHYQFVSDYYRIEQYRITYESEFHFIPDKEFWREYDINDGIIPLIPPSFRRRSGRPRTSRIRNTMDENVQSGRRCGTCKNTGHNAATCPQNASSSRYGQRPTRRRPPPC